MLKVNLIGQGHSFYLAEMLTDFGVQADTNSDCYDYYDINLTMGLWYQKPKVPNSVIFFMGSDVWRDHVKIPKAELYLIPSEDMFKTSDIPFKDEARVKFWQMPINSRLFRPLKWLYPLEKRDCLLYCPNPQTYRLDRNLEEIENNPDKTYTMLGGGYQDFLSSDKPENLLTIANIPHTLMWLMYLRHKEIKTWIDHPGCGTPLIVNYEAFNMGLKSYYNDQEVTELRKDKDSEEAIPYLISILTNLKT